MASKQTRTKQQQQETAPRKPSHRVFVVVGDGDEANWTEVGALWPHKDGKGFTGDLKAAPIKGRLVIRLIEARAEGGQQ